MKLSHKASRKLLVCFISFEHWPYSELLLGGKGHLIINYPLCIAVMRAFFIMQVKYNINSGHASVFPSGINIEKISFFNVQYTVRTGGKDTKAWKPCSVFPKPIFNAVFISDWTFSFTKIKHVVFVYQLYLI